MRSCCAVYVDAGYLLASAATRVTGTSLRSGVTVDHASLVAALIRQAEAESGLPLLRVNWYDSGALAGGSPDRQQEQIGLLPRVKLRLGRLNPYGEQKGVDLRLGLDLVTHARNRVIDLIYLVSGDDDLTEAVEEAQGHGVEVVLMGVPNADGRPHAVSRHLQQEADGLILVDPAAVDAAVSPRPRGGAQSAAVAEPVAARPVAAAAAAPATPVAPPAAGAAGPAVGPAVPVMTPADVARLARRHPAPPVADRRTPAALVYSSTTGSPAAPDEGVTEEQVQALIDEVCAGVLSTWASTATAEAREALLASRPYIPQDVDRALLLDLSSRLGVYDIDEPTRFELRARFWDHVKERIAS